MFTSGIPPFLLELFLELFKFLYHLFWEGWVEANVAWQGFFGRSRCLHTNAAIQGLLPPLSTIWMLTSEPAALLV